MSPVQNAGPAPANFPASHWAVDRLRRQDIINLLTAYGQATDVRSILLLSTTVKFATESMPSASQGSVLDLKDRFLSYIGR